MIEKLGTAQYNTDEKIFWNPSFNFNQRQVINLLKINSILIFHKPKLPMFSNFEGLQGC